MSRLTTCVRGYGNRTLPQPYTRVRLAGHASRCGGAMSPPRTTDTTHATTSGLHTRRDGICPSSSSLNIFTGSKTGNPAKNNLTMFAGGLGGCDLPFPYRSLLFATLRCRSPPHRVHAVASLSIWLPSVRNKNFPSHHTPEALVSHIMTGSRASWIFWMVLRR